MVSKGPLSTAINKPAAAKPPKKIITLRASPTRRSGPSGPIDHLIERVVGSGEPDRGELEVGAVDANVQLVQLVGLGCISFAFTTRRASRRRVRWRCRGRWDARRVDRLPNRGVAQVRWLL